jgi:four helix bundle protein
MEFEDLIAYKKAYANAMLVFEASKSFPSVEKYSLTDQIRRSSRSVCANIAEAYRKRRYPKHFVSKLTDADGENSETAVRINFAFSCKYISKEQFKGIHEETLQIGKLINYMLNNPKKFGSDNS